jgi:hypothetical protein
MDEGRATHAPNPTNQPTGRTHVLARLTIERSDDVGGEVCALESRGVRINTGSAKTVQLLNALLEESVIWAVIGPIIGRLAI